MNYKIALIPIVTISLSLTEQQKIEGYIRLFEDASSAKYFTYGKTNYYEYFSNEKETINGTEYYVRFRKYGWGKVDTTYYRKGERYYLHFNKKVNQESKLLPLEPRKGDTWTESDNSWSYEVIAIEQKFKTLKEKYANCIKVHCVQLTGRDKEKSKEYFLYYSPKYGYFGNTDGEGKVLSYLSDFKLNAKTGDKLGGN
ncbi:MAG: hypothetical protein AAF717_11545 [Bacteroidota bacterium]